MDDRETSDEVQLPPLLRKRRILARPDVPTLSGAGWLDLQQGFPNG